MGSLVPSGSLFKHSNTKYAWKKTLSIIFFWGGGGEGAPAAPPSKSATDTIVHHEPTLIIRYHPLGPNCKKLYCY